MVSYKDVLYLEPLKIYGAGEYNLDSVKEIKATASFHDLAAHQKGCQSEETLGKCTSRQFIDAFLNICNCLPFNIKHAAEVHQE